jgi:hypothetical protein
LLFLKKFADLSKVMKMGEMEKTNGTEISNFAEDSRATVSPSEIETVGLNFMQVSKNLLNCKKINLISKVEAIDASCSGESPAVKQPMNAHPGSLDTRKHVRWADQVGDMELSTVDYFLYEKIRLEFLSSRSIFLNFNLKT